MANIGSEIERALAWRGKGRPDYGIREVQFTRLFLGLMICFVVVSPARCQQEARFPAGVDPDGQLLALGLLDVTKKPYLADPEGKVDSTEAIRKAVNDARDHGLVCFFPVGTYLISDTISCEQENYKLDSPRQVDGSTANYWHKNHKIILLGSTKEGKRPVLKLSKSARGFNNPSKPKIAVRIWARTWFGDGTGEQPNISFGHYFIGIDIDIRGHAGAIGLKHSGSQGCTLQDSTIYAEGAFAGLYNCPGQGAGTFNVEVIGGDYGFFADARSRFPILVGCRFRNQAKAAIAYTSGGTQVPTLLVGCLIESQSGKAVDLSTEPKYAGVSMIDCVVRLDRGVVALTRKTENVFLENTYLKGADGIYPGGPKIASAQKWTLVERYSSQTEDAVSLIDGKESSGDFFQWRTIPSAPDYTAILGRHWRPRPSFEDPDAVNVKSFGAKGDGATDDSNAFERAVRSHDEIFVPPGTYRLSGDLALKRNTQLFALSPFLTSIGGSGGRREPSTATGAAPFTLSTPDDEAAAPGLWFLAVNGAINWMSGRGTAMHARAAYRFSGNAGGKLYAVGAMRDQFLVENIRNPLAFYSLNVERVTRNPQSLIRNSRGVRVYYFKVEAGTRNSGEIGGGDENTPVCIVNSQDVRIYCLYGNVKGLSAERPMLQVVDSRQVLVSQLRAFSPGVFPHLSETNGARVNVIPSSKTCALYIRGQSN